MKKHDLADLLAEKSHIQKAAAAEEVDRIVHKILTTLQKGKPATLPGLGRFQPGRTPKFQLERGSNVRTGTKR